MNPKTKTKSDIQSEFLAMVQGSTLAAAVNGAVYRSDGVTSYRPRDSRKEDIEVIVSTAHVAQVQYGVVTILAYVPDIDPYDNGVLVENGARTSTLQRTALDWIESHPERGTGYRLWLDDTVDSIAIPDISQHAVSIQIHYEFYE